MISRIIGGVAVSIWVWMAALVAAGIAVPLVLVGLIFGGTISSAAGDLHYQCDSLVGPDPSDTETTAAVSNGGDDSGNVGDSVSPSTNPYADLTVEAGDTGISSWQRGCVSILKSVPYQLPPLKVSNGGFGVECARELALAQVGRAGTETVGGTSGPNSPSGDVMSAALTRYVIFEASSAAGGGRCIDSVAANPHGNVTSAAPASDPVLAGPGSCLSRLDMASGGQTPMILLPDTLAGQGLCGQRVDPSAASAGDLVFWNYHNDAPTRCGVAVGPEQIVTTDPSAGHIVTEQMPNGRDVRVKRVLSGGS